MSRDYIFTDGSTIPVGTMYCVGKNYAAHAREMGGTVPAAPMIFIKPPAAYLPDGGTVLLPPISNMVHHEVELVVVIGKDCENISQSEANKYISGYAVGLDITLRDLQNKAKTDGSPWAVAKGFVTSAPLSKIVPAGKLPENPQFELELYVNNELRQHGFTNNMERSVPVLIEYLSKIFTLRRGDCIFTGTPEGVGQIMKGDVLTAELKGLVGLKVKVDSAE